MRVLLYSHHSRQGAIDEYVSRSLRNIAHNFDSVYFLTNVADAAFERDNITPMHFDARTDFEAFIGFFLRFPEVASAASMLYLVNDTVLIQKAIDLPVSPRIDVFGLTESRQRGDHIQSYFIGFHNHDVIHMAVGYLKRFPGSFEDKQAVIDYCEIGLSRYLIERRRRTVALFSPPAGLEGNPTQVCWKTLLQKFGILKRNVLLGTGDYGLDDIRLDELLPLCHGSDWRSIAARLHVPRRGAAASSASTPKGEFDELLDEVYGRILLRPCDPSGLETYSRFLGSHSVSELEQVLRGSEEYRVLQDVATAYREVLGRFPDRYGVHAYREEVQKPHGVERLKGILAGSVEHRYNLEGEADYRRLCRECAHRFAAYTTRLERNGSVEAVLIETRREESLRFVIPNTVSRMPHGWGLTVFHGDANAGFVRKACAGIENVNFVRLPDAVDLSDFRHYNRLLTDPHFWERFASERVFLFQWDSLLTGGGIERFAVYDYIGAPRRSGHVGNGGFSIRSVRAMREIAARCRPGDFENEDEFFSRHLYAGGFRMPDATVAGQFCTEFPDEALAYHRPWLARDGVRLAALFRAAPARVPGDATDASPIPVLLVIDVEPDPRLVKRPDRWYGFEALYSFLSEQRPGLEDATGSAVNFCWLLRLDHQIEIVYGHPGWAIMEYRALIDEARGHGDELGLHTHAWRRQGGTWLSDCGNPQWVARCVARSHAAFVHAMGFAPRTFTHGDRYMSDALMDQLESLDFAVDATLQPGRPRVSSLVTSERTSGSLPDFTGVPRQPYHPSRADYRRQGTGDARRILEVPLSVSERPATGNTGDGSLLLGAPFERVHRVIDDNLARPTPYLHAAMRTDVLLDAGNRHQFAEAISYLSTHRLRDRFVFQTPAMLAHRG